MAAGTAAESGLAYTTPHHMCRGESVFIMQKDQVAMVPHTKKGTKLKFVNKPSLTGLEFSYKIGFLVSPVLRWPAPFQTWSVLSYCVLISAFPGAGRAF